nr:PXMP2/4 family protein 2 isoform X2 [Ipomoea batatas]
MVSKDRPLGSFLRSRSVNFIDFLPQIGLTGEAQHRRVRTSMSFREAIGFDKEKHDFLVLCFDSRVETRKQEMPPQKHHVASFPKVKLKKAEKTLVKKKKSTERLTEPPPKRSLENCMAERPLETQVISSGILWAIADVVAQSISISTAKKRLLISGSNKELTMDRKRVGITCMYGIGFFGPLGHFWYKGLDQFIKLRFRLQPNSLQFLATKVAVDILVFGPLNLLLFFTYMGFSMGKSASQVKETIKRDFLPALALEGSVWPLAQAVNFRYVPVQYQLLYVNVFSLLDSAFLSWLEQQQKDPPGNQCYALVPISNDPKDEFK